MKPERVYAVVLVAVLLVVLSASVEVETASEVKGQQPCSAQGVQESDLSSQTFGAVTLYSLPKPLRSPNSVLAAADNSVWFGEVGLRGLAHLFSNGTLVEYAWPPALPIPAKSCYDLSEVWGLVSWHGLIWASDSFNDRLVGLNTVDHAFQTIQLRSDSAPRSLAVDEEGNLWFTQSSTPAEVGEVDGSTGSISYFSIPAPGEFSASLLFSSRGAAYVTTVNPSTDLGHVFAFDPASADPSFGLLNSNQTLLAPYSSAVGQGGLWVGEHHASNVAFLNQTSRVWTFYPTSTSPQIPLSLPYYLQANGSQVWFNEHDAAKIAVICCGGTSLTEYNISSTSLSKTGIGNTLTFGLDRNLVWFADWTGNQVGFVNASRPIGFSINTNSTGPTVILRGSSATAPLFVNGTFSGPLRMQFSDSESYTSVPSLISLTTTTPSVSNLSGSSTVIMTVRVSQSLAPGSYLVLATVTDGLVYRSVYIQIIVQ